MLRVVSHTPIEVEKLNAARNAGGWIDGIRELTPEPEKLLYMVELSRRRLGNRRPRPPPSITSGPHQQLADRVGKIAMAKNYRGAVRPSDHVPVTATLEV